MNINTVLICGNLTRDINIEYTKSGIAVGSFSLALNRRYTSNGEKKEEVSFVSVTIFGKQAENAVQYLKKGDECAVRGRLKQENWEKEGQRHSKLGVIGEEIIFGNKQKTSAGRNYQQSPQEQSGMNSDEVPF